MTSTSPNTNNGQHRSSTNIKSEYIQKLSNEKALAEAIMIGRKPCLAVVDFSDPDNVRIHIMDSLSFNEDTKLAPELLNNRPYIFKNKEEFYSYVERAKGETLDSLFDKTLSTWKKYIDADGFHLKICTADTIYTYKQDILGSTHYLFFIADNDAGKSNNLKLFNILAYRNLMNTGMTHANIYNFLGSRDEGAGTICIDEADSIDKYPLMMEILKCGYNKGTPVVRILDSPRRQVKFNTYCFKAIAGERLPDEVEARGFMQRTIVIKCVPGFPKYDISEITDPAGDIKYEDLLNELNDLRDLLFCHRLVHFNDKIPNINLNIRNREKQLFKPLLRMFQGTRTFDVLRPVISNYINERRKSKANSLHAFVYTIVKDLIESKKTLELDFSMIWDFIRSNIICKDIPYKPQSIETVEFGVISQKQVGSILKNVFGGVPPKHTGSSRRLIFSQHILDRMKDIYETNIDINVDLETTESLDDQTMFGFGTDGTDGTLSESNNTGTASQVTGTNENTENDKGNDKNLEEIDTKSRNDNVTSLDEADVGELSENLSHVSQVSQTNQTIQNQIKKSYSDYLIDGIPIWEIEKRGMTEEEAQAFRNELERLNKDVKSKSKSKSKVTCMADANLSGDGVMLGNGNGNGDDVAYYYKQSIDGTEEVKKSR